MSKEQKRQAFYTQDQDLVLREMETSKEGLTTSEATKRLSEYGRNELDEGEKKSLLMKFIEQFKDLMIIILLVAAVLSVVTSGGEDIADAIIILAVVIINAAFGVYQEGKAEEAIEALKSMSSPAARVLRDGHVAEVDSKELVPGDIVILEAGDVVPLPSRQYDRRNNVSYSHDRADSRRRKQEAAITTVLIACCFFQCLRANIEFAGSWLGIFLPSCSWACLTSTDSWQISDNDIIAVIIHWITLL